MKRYPPVIVAALLVVALVYVVQGMPGAPSGVEADTVFLPVVRSTRNDLQILSNHTLIDSFSGTIVVGEVRNYTTDYRHFVALTIKFWNAANQLVHTESLFGFFLTLPPGEKTCFNRSVLNPPAEWARFDLEKTTSSSSSESREWTEPNLVVVESSGLYEPSSGSFKIIGQIRNDDEYDVRAVRPVGTVYNAQGQVVGCEFTYLYELAAGKSIPFELEFRHYISEVASWRVQVTGDPQ